MSSLFRGKSLLHPNHWRWLCLAALVVLLLLFIAANLFFSLPKTLLHPPVSCIVLDRNGEWLRAFLAQDGMWRIREPDLAAVSLWLKQATLTMEDRWFAYHFGINPVSMVNAAIENLRSRKVVRGGSTITMQLARMMEPKARNIPNKCIEMFRALQLELTYSKSELLTFYFNMLPYGGNIVGSAAAARLYFNKPQQALSIGEAALLAAIPNSPERLRPDRFPQRARKAREKVLRRLFALGQISRAQFESALQEPIPTKLHRFPFKAPHLSRLLASSHVQGGPIYTTVDMKKQQTAVRLLREHLEGLQTVSTGAVVIMATQTREVLALVGSHDFFDTAALGQVNGVLAPRSPGSALKPFVYALAIDQGIITPASLLLDVPVSYGGYRPVNYDGTYTGYVSARRALAQSLNVPAVNLTVQLDKEPSLSGARGTPSWYSPHRRAPVTLTQFLKQAGISTLSNTRRYGLSIVLGGCEVNLLELTTLYASLANMGEFVPYCLTLQEAEGKSQLIPAPVRLFREETAFMITEMLTTRARPDFPADSFEKTVNLPKIAWKTGTSYGHRDAWSIGYSRTFTIGVWLGNFDGKGIPLLSGSSAATPLLFSLFTALMATESHQWFTPPAHLKTRQVCVLSGQPAARHCPTRKNDTYIPGVSTVRPCTLHKRVYIHKATGYSVCSHCWNLSVPEVDNDQRGSDERGTRVFTGKAPFNIEERILEEWPAEAATWLAKNGFAVPAFPPHNPDCTAFLAGETPSILSPSKGTVYYIRQGIPLEHQKIMLNASISNRTQELYWFLDGELISTESTYFLTPVPGHHVITCVDGAGRAATRPLLIKHFVASNPTR